VNVQQVIRERVKQLCSRECRSASAVSKSRFAISAALEANSRFASYEGERLPLVARRAGSIPASRTTAASNVVNHMIKKAYDLVASESESHPREKVLIPSESPRAGLEIYAVP